MKAYQVLWMISERGDRFVSVRALFADLHTANRAASQLQEELGAAAGRRSRPFSSFATIPGVLDMPESQYTRPCSHI